MIEEVRISKRYTNHDLANRKVHPIKVFEDRLRYWLLEPLKKLKGNNSDDYDFIVLSSIFPMFECLGMFLTGQSSERQTKKFFQKGFEEVVWNPVFGNAKISSQDKAGIITHLYKHGRNGFAHSGITRDKIIIQQVEGKPMEFSLQEGVIDVIRIDPWKLLNVFGKWFDGYVRILKEGKDEELLQNFEKTWNRETPEICGGSSH